MKAIVCDSYGPPENLRFEEVSKPEPKDDEILVKIKAASLNAADWRFMRGRPLIFRPLAFGWPKPKNKIPGADMAGEVEAVGKKVKEFKSGDKVYGNLMMHGGGAFAEYVAVKEAAISKMPSNVSFEVGASLPLAGVTALSTVRDNAQIKPGETVLINGAAGSVGTFMIQMVKLYGAEITAVCNSRNHETARKLGADHVIDYNEQNFTELDKKYDHIIAVNGYHPIRAYKRCLTPTGNYIMVGGSGWQLFEGILMGPILSKKGGQQLRVENHNTEKKDLEDLRDLVEAEKLTAHIDKRYTLSEVPEAMAYLEEGHARGKIVITMN